MDTAAFYTDAEHEIDVELTQRRFELFRLKTELQIIQDYHSGKIKENQALRQLMKLKDQVYFVVPNKEEIVRINEDIGETKKVIKQCKERLRREFTSPPPMRELRTDQVNVISVFESDLNRTLKMKTDELSDALIIVRVFYFDSQFLG